MQTDYSTKNSIEQRCVGVARSRPLVVFARLRSFCSRRLDRFRHANIFRQSFEDQVQGRPVGRLGDRGGNGVGSGSTRISEAVVLPGSGPDQWLLPRLTAVVLTDLLGGVSEGQVPR